MYNSQTHTYVVPINPPVEGQSQTVHIVQIKGSATGRLSLMRKWMRHHFPLTRKEANKVIYEMGFNDLIPCAA